MESASFMLRPFRPEDGGAYAALLAASPDTGSIGTVETFEIDPYQVLVGVHDEARGLVAETPGYEGLVGGACVRFGRCQWEGELRPSALLNTVAVHPGFRRKGLASQLEDFAARQFTTDGVFFAVIQRNNIGSERAAGKWAGQILRGRLTFISKPTRSTRPSGPYVVRPILSEELAVVADRMNEYYRDYNLYPPESPDSLAAWLGKTPFDARFRHYRVVTDRRGSLRGGMAVTETYRLRTTQITRMPAILRVLNRVFRVVPISGQLREVTVSRAWSGPGQHMAMRHLLETVCWEWRETATTIMVYADVRGPMMRVCNVRPWTGAVIAGFAVRAPVACSEERLFYYA
ncbi:MAG: GNAT family N-acetyltransferase [Chloroflexi bacterium]|nr:GNAT family N-acetyltransferase [Chloroflexota bacterium]